MKKILFLSLVFFSGICLAQDKIPFIDYDIIAAEVGALSGDDKNERALELINKISKNDSTYCSILTSKSYYLIMSEKYEDAIDVTDEGLSLDCESSSRQFFMMNKGVALENLERYKEAIELYDKGLEDYPANHKLWFNKATCYEKMGDLDKAVEAYKKVITISPSYRNAHLYLGNICYQQNLTAQALMCLNMALLVEPDTERAFALLKSLNEIISDKNTNEPEDDLEISIDDEAFEDINLILDNRIALSDKYRIDNEIDIAVVKQSHAMMEQLEDFEGNGGFWDKYYVPLFKWIKDNDQFDNFVYTLTYSIKNEKLKKLVQKKTDDVKGFIGNFMTYTYDTMSPQNQTVDGTEKEVNFYYSNRVLQAEGKSIGETSVGDWTFYNDNGGVLSKGGYDDNGERDGKWSWYYENGQLKETAIYTNGSLNGENRSWYENGKPYVVNVLKDGKTEGEYIYYLPSGALKQRKYYEADILNGKYLAYFDVGEVIQPEFDIDYADGKVMNKVKEYYANGDLYSEIEFKNGQRNGIETQYYWNKQKSLEATYVDDQLQGPYTKYHSNGQISEQGQSSNNFYDGKWKTYYSDGTLEAEFEYDEGKPTGIYKYYDTDGKPYYEFEYRRGEIISYKYFDKAGEIITENRKKGGKFYFKGFHPNGNIMSEGRYDIKGGKMGVWKFFNINGELTESGNYEEDKAVGEHTYYYPNGEISSISKYDAGDLTDYYQSFHINGKLQTQGWYKNGYQHGEWRYYSIDGTLSNISFYHKGKAHGEEQIFGASGDLTRINTYKYGDLVKAVIYNEKNEVNQTIDYENADLKYTLVIYHYNGNKEIEIDYVNGLKHGNYKNYDFDGNLYITGTYVNNQMNGEWIWRFPDGTVSHRENYLHGSKNGKLLGYYENGQVEDESYFDYGVKTGTWLSYFEDGMIDNKTEYVNDLEHGRKEFYSQTGKLQLVRHYNYGTVIGYSYLDKSGEEIDMIPITKETGKVEAYYDNGKLSRTFSYKNGQFDGDYKTYYYSGVLENELVYVNGDYHGIYVDYYPDGSIKRKSNYYYGELDGEYLSYHPNGKPKEIINFKNGSRHGEYKRFDESGKLVKTKFYFNGSVYKTK